MAELRRGRWLIGRRKWPSYAVGGGGGLADWPTEVAELCRWVADRSKEAALNGNHRIRTVRPKKDDDDNNNKNFSSFKKLVFVLLFIFVKRQIMRFAMKSRRGPHAPIGHNAPKDLREEIDRSLLKVQDLDYEPQLLDEGDVRLLQLQEPGSQVRYNYLYRMKALDAIRHVDLPIGEGADFAKRLTGKSFRSFLLELRQGNTPFRGVRKNLIDKLIDGYEAARYGTTIFGKTEYLKYERAVNELAAIIQARSTRSQTQHQTAAKDLTASSETSSPTTIQVTYLPSNQKSKRPKHFLELKSFKENYNTLESTL